MSHIGCSWSKKIPPKLVTTSTIDELYPVPQDKLNYCAIPTTNIENIKPDVFLKLNNLGSVIGLTWLLSPESETIPLIELEDIIRSAEFEK